MIWRCLFVAVLVVETVRGRPSRIASTSLNLPISEAVEKGDTASGKISDTAKDYTVVEPTFRDMTVRNYIHQAFINFLHPTPIVDNLQEEDKYGNDGDKLERAGNFVVKGTEVATKAVGSLVTVPRNAIATVSNSITQRLNSVGAAIVGI